MKKARCRKKHLYEVRFSVQGDGVKLFPLDLLLTEKAFPLDQPSLDNIKFSLIESYLHRPIKGVKSPYYLGLVNLAFHSSKKSSLPRIHAWIVAGWPVVGKITRK